MRETPTRRAWREVIIPACSAAIGVSVSSAVERFTALTPAAANGGVWAHAVCGGARMTVELLYFEGCPGGQALVSRLRALVAEAGLDPDHAMTLRRIESPEEAQRARFLGSPSVRVDGSDVEPGADGRSDYGLKCRLYESEAGPSRIPPEPLIARALARGRR
jgi:hypothetical protein